MEKTLKVVEPFFVMEPGDTFELSENGTYVSNYTEEYNNIDANNDADIFAKYHSSYTISPDLAKTLVEHGYLENEKTEDQKFVNVFDEIQTLIDTYSYDLSNLDTIHKNDPACVKNEHETVLANMMKVLKHLQSLKK